MFLGVSLKTSERELTPTINTIMKVIEVINESLIGSALKGVSSLVSKSGAAKTAPKVTPSVPASTKINTKALSKSDRNALAKLLRQGRKANADDVKSLLGQVRNAQLQQNADKIVKMATTLNIIQESAFYYIRVGELDDQLASGAITQDEYQKKLLALRGQFLFGVLGPKIAYMMAKPLRMIGSVIPGTMKIFGAPGAAEYTRLISSAAAKTALTAFLATDKGKEAMNNFFGGYATGFFELAAQGLEAIFDVLKASYDVATDAPLPGGASSAADKTSADRDKLSDILLGKGSGDLYQQVGRKSGL